ncbi:unnamed protein product [Rhizophagus irregularis]|uniref:MIR domain-containing protein n=1 Tax=Rhizophagus irregularis TaxID=588596 RepID=A0A915YZM9_9GLOM|nr:unnamed protein product [Rhizophagus irregularis]
MDFPKYNGNIHPDEWIKDLQNYLEYYRPIKDSLSESTRAKFALSLVDSNILLPTEIDSIVKVRNALKEDISFTLFKNTNKRKLQSLKYIPESRALKHVGTGKYLSSTENFYYTTGSKFQLIFAGSPVPDSNSLWKIKFGKELATYNNTSIRLQHVKSSNKFLGIYYSNRGRCYYTSPSTNHTEVSCNSTSHIKFLRSHDIQFTIGNDTFQEVVCHNERLGGNDEWCIELIKQHIWTIDT